MARRFDDPQRALNRRPQEIRQELADDPAPLELGKASPHGAGAGALDR
jgi:hypothetical protein